MICRQIVSYRRMPWHSLGICACAYGYFATESTLIVDGCGPLGSPYHATTLDQSSWLLHAGPAQFSDACTFIYRYISGVYAHRPLLLTVIDACAYNPDRLYGKYFLVQENSPAPHSV